MGIISHSSLRLDFVFRPQVRTVQLAGADAYILRVVDPAAAGGGGRNFSLSTENDELRKFWCRASCAARRFVFVFDESFLFFFRNSKCKSKCSGISTENQQNSMSLCNPRIAVKFRGKSTNVQMKMFQNLADVHCLWIHRKLANCWKKCEILLHSGNVSR